MKNIVIFASGNGSNAARIIRHFNGGNKAHVVAVICNNPNAFVLKRADELKVPSFVFNKEALNYPDALLNKLKELKTDLIVLAGYLKLMPPIIVEHFTNRIINIHPALLPKYGGRGMYGMNVHKAVFDAHENETGITIHYVNEKYDDGKIIFQERVPVDENDTPETIAEKVSELEKKNFTTVIEKVIDQL
ncbi:MAG: phosphoribosylglycinamide formyltransferase [Bacteroidia bacterium]